MGSISTGYHEPRYDGRNSLSCLVDHYAIASVRKWGLLFPHNSFHWDALDWFPDRMA